MSEPQTRTEITISILLIILFLCSLICVNIGVFMLSSTPGLLISGGFSGFFLTWALDRVLS